MNKTLQALLAEHEDLYPVLLARDFPHVIARIEALWGQPGMNKFLAALTPDDLGPRKGFPPEIVAEIVALRDYYQTCSPEPLFLDQPLLPGSEPEIAAEPRPDAPPTGMPSPVPEKKPELALAPVDEDFGDVWKNERVRKF